MTLTAQDVAEITRLLEESEFDELHLEHEGFKLTLRRGAAARAPPTPPAAATAGDRAGRRGAARRVASSAGARGRATLLEVAAPLLGTFYRAPKPGAAPFVEVGSAVEEDTIIGIIEVMKLMNTVRAGVRGTVAEICVQRRRAGRIRRRCCCASRGSRSA